MLKSTVIVNAALFFALSGLHFYWAAGGRLGKMQVLPVRANSTEKLFMPSLKSTIVVAVGLMLFALAAIGSLGYFQSILDKKYFLWSNFIMGLIFLARAIGDFRYLGFSKRIRDTEFARNDSKYFAPISALLAIDSFIIFLLG